LKHKDFELVKSRQYFPTVVISTQKVPPQSTSKDFTRYAVMAICLGLLLSVAMTSFGLRDSGIHGQYEFEFQSEPFSSLDPRSLGILEIDRAESSRPGRVFGDLRHMHIPLPTNSWCKNLFLGFTNESPNNNVFQLPYVVDAAGYIKVRKAAGCIKVVLFNNEQWCNV